MYGWLLRRSVWEFSSNVDPFFLSFLEFWFFVQKINKNASESKTLKTVEKCVQTKFSFVFIALTFLLRARFEAQNKTERKCNAKRKTWQRECSENQKWIEIRVSVALNHMCWKIHVPFATSKTTQMNGNFSSTTITNEKNWAMYCWLMRWDCPLRARTE